MHQHPRVPPAAASPARAPQTNPVRSNNPREGSLHSRQSSESSGPADQGIYMTEAGQNGIAARDTTPEGKLDLVVQVGPITIVHPEEDPLSDYGQNYFYKAALMILDSRVTLKQAYTVRENKPRVNRWFNTELPETDELLESTRRWKHAMVLRERLPDMIVETYLDLKDLAGNQKLVITDESGKRQDVEAALRERIGNHTLSDDQLRKCSIMLERWTCSLGAPWPEVDENFPLNDVLPKVYKRSIVLFRTLFTQLKLMPAWKLCKRVGKPGVPRIRWRIYDATQRRRDAAFDELDLPLIASNERVTETFRWDPIDSPAGQFSISATYRSSCDFTVDTSESLFNSQFMASDERWFQPSLPRSSVLDGRVNAAGSRPVGPGAASPDHRDSRTRRKLDEIVQKGPAYGSMSTYHNPGGGKIGTSPLSALRAARELNSRSPTETAAPLADDGRPMSRSGSRTSHDTGRVTPVGRRPSVSIQPFKTPAYSSSLPADQAAPPSPRLASFNRNSPLAALAEARHPNVAPNTPLSPRTSPKPANAVPVNAAAGAPRPAPSRFSSSFSHRRHRSSLGGTSNGKTDEDNVSSGRGSTSSSNLQNTPSNEGPASASLQTDDDNISDFLKMLDSRKELKSFRTSPADAAGSSAARGTTATLSKFHQLRESHTALSDSLSSSQMLQRSSVSSASRQLANVPPMVAGTSTSIASSPGDRISPRTPHTPAIPSRLSNNSIIEYNQTERGQRPRPHRFSVGYEAATGADGITAGPQASTAVQGNAAHIAGAIPIPTSPRMYQSSYRRSSSAANHHNRGGDTYDLSDDLGDILPFALRSASLGDGDEREPLTISGLIALQEAQMPVAAGVHSPGVAHEGQNVVDAGSPRPRPSAVGSPVQARGESEATAGLGSPIEQSSSSRDLARDRPPSSVRHSFSRPTGLTSFEDEEPLLFAMSEQLEGGSAGPGTSRGDAAAGDNTGADTARGGRMQQRW